MSEVRECSKRVGTWHCMVLTRLPGGLCSAHQPKAATRRNRALSAARDEVVRAAVALAPDIASQWDDGDGWRSVSLPSDAAAAFCAAVAALARLEAR